MKLLKSSLIFFLGVFFFLSFSWLILGRETKIELRINRPAISVWEEKRLLVQTKGKLINPFSLSLSLKHDKDSFWVLPFKKQRVEIFYENGDRQRFFLTQPKSFELFRDLKSQFKFGRQPWAAKYFFNDSGLTTHQEVFLKEAPIKKIILDTWNLNEARVILTSKAQKDLALWFRPKFHHDGNVTFEGKTIPFKTPVGGSSAYYLKILIGLLAKTFIGSFLILTLSLLLMKILPKKLPSLPRLDRNSQKLISFLIPFLVFITAILVSIFVLEKIPHCQDEVAYLFQAKIFSQGQLYIESLPGESSRFFDHEFIVNNGRWFSAFPPGASLFFSLGVLLQHPHLINPLISALNVFLLILFSKKLFSRSMAIFATILYVASPFFLLISSSFLSHPASLLFTLLSVIAFIEICQKPAKTYPWLLLGLSVGLLSLVRPTNALILGLFFFMPLIEVGLKNLRPAIVAFTAISLFALINAYYNFQLTGNPLVLPHNVYSPFNQLGFGMRGTEWGSAFALKDAFKNLTFNFYSFLDMLFRWPPFLTCSFIPFAFFGKFKKKALFLMGLFLAQVGLYFFYFNEGTFMGPRFWFEVAWIPALLTVAGLKTMTDFFPKEKRKVTFASYLIFFSLLFYGAISSFAVLPSFKGFNGMRPQEIPSLKTPAVVFIPGQGSWQAYGRYFIRMSPFLDEPVIFARDQAIHNVPKNLPPLPNKLLKSVFPNRHFYLYQEELLFEL